jgi:tetratricopeptide (TPR) repeat protein
MILLVFSCTTKKDAFLNRAFHRTTAYYNAYFNANELFKTVVTDIENAHVDNYRELLEVDPLGSEDVARGYHGQLDEVIEKCTNMIKRHSMVIKGDEKNSRIDDNYMLLAKAQFYKQEYIAASSTFNYIARQYEDGEYRVWAMIWESYAQIKLKNHQTAALNFSSLEEDEELSKAEKSKLYTIKAQYYIHQEEYENAIDALNMAIDLGVKKKMRIRYHFIIAQLYTKLGEFENTIEYYEKVVRSNPSYDIKFNALMNEANAFDTEADSPEDLRNRLIDMSEDSKNTEYLDQIYFALADLAFKEGDQEECLDYLLLSASNSIDNSNQKARSHLRIANIYFDDQDYRMAQGHYDTVVSLINEDFPGYKKIKVKRESLNTLVSLYGTIELQDSLIRIGKMSEGDRMAFIDKYIEDLKAKIAEEKRLQEQAEADKQFFTPGQSVKQNPFAISGGGWYFYNTSAVSYGYSEFIARWGSRKLEDNWRRKDKSQNFADEYEEEDLEEDGARFDPETYLANIPVTEEAIAESYDLIADAYYQLGLLYKEDLEDYNAAVKEFQTLRDRFSDTKYDVIAHYQLFRLFLELKDPSQAEKHKSYVLTKYPDSHFAKSIQGISIDNLEEQDGGVMQALYLEAYQQFEAAQYDEVIASCSKVINLYPTEKMLAKFVLLKAMATGGADGKNAYIKSLVKMIEDYPKADEVADAERILNYLQGDVETFDTNKFSKTKRTEHFYVLFIETDAVDVNELSIKISDFNKKNYSKKELSIKNIILNEDYQVVTVKLFRTADEGLEYYDKIIKDYRIKSYFDTGKLTQTIMSSDNFSTFYKGDKNLIEYLHFFNEEYIKRRKG